MFLIDYTLNAFALGLLRWFIIIMFIILLVLIFIGLLWYFTKIWNSKDNVDERKLINNSIKWMIFSWLGLLTSEVILVIIYSAFK